MGEEMLGGNKGEGEEGEPGRSAWERGWEECRKKGRRRGEAEQEQEGEGYGRTEAEDREEQERERWERIRGSRFNGWYKEVVATGVPGYLKRGWGEERYRRVARFRLGNEMREGRYWETEEERKCRVCGEEEESWEHVIDRCGGGEGEERGIGERVREILDEGGGGEEWMKRLQERRKEREEEK